MASLRNRTSLLTLLGIIALAIFGCRPANIPEKPASRSESEVNLSIIYPGGLTHSTGGRQTLSLGLSSTLRVLITNNGDKPIALWMPNTPLGDDMVRIEFKQNTGANEIGIAQCKSLYWGVTSGPSPINLGPSDSLIHDIDFDDGWIFPASLTQLPWRHGETREFMVRVVFESIMDDTNPLFREFNELMLKDSVNNASEVEEIWKGRLETNWQPVSVYNQTGRVLNTPVSELQEK